MLLTTYPDCKHDKAERNNNTQKTAETVIALTRLLNAVFRLYMHHSYKQTVLIYDLICLVQITLSERQVSHVTFETSLGKFKHIIR